MHTDYKLIALFAIQLCRKRYLKELHKSSIIFKGVYGAP